MEFGNLKELGPVVFGVLGSYWLGMGLGCAFGARSDYIALYGAISVALYGTGHYIYRNRDKIAEKCRNNLTEIYSRLYKLGQK
jgi:hypothetical protein